MVCHCVWKKSEREREVSISTYILSVYLDIKTTKQMTRGLLQSFGRRRNKIATFAVMYHVHVNSFPVCGTVVSTAPRGAVFETYKIQCVAFVLMTNYSVAIAIQRAPHIVSKFPVLIHVLVAPCFLIFFS